MYSRLRASKRAVHSSTEGRLSLEPELELELAAEFGFQISKLCSSVRISPLRLAFSSLLDADAAEVEVVQYADVGGSATPVSLPTYTRYHRAYSLTPPFSPEKQLLLARAHLLLITLPRIAQ